MGNPPQYFGLEYSMDRGAWRVTAHRVAKSQTGLKQLSTYAHPRKFLGFWKGSGVVMLEAPQSNSH